MNKIQHFFQVLTVLSTVLFLGTTSLQGQICPATVNGACGGSFLAVTGEFNATSGVTGCPSSITLSDGTTTVIIPLSGTGECNSSEESYLQPGTPTFDCSATEFTIDVGGPEICNYTAATGFNNGGILPVELSKFVAYLNQSTILLEWETVMELNNEYFTVEKSTDGRNFEAIGKLEGAGFSSDIRQYMFVDNKPADGRNYYRLKQTDFSGESEYFEVVVVDYRASGEVTIYPNPVSESMTLNLTGNLIDQPADVAIYSMSSGKRVSLTSVDAVDYQLDINVADLPKGMYSVVVNVGTQIFNKKIVKN